MGGETGRIADVVEMVMRPDYSGDVVASDIHTRSVGVEDFGDVFFCADCSGCLYELDRAGGVILPVTTDAKVEQDMLSAVGYEEAVDRSISRFDALDLWAPKYLRVDAQSCGTGLHEPVILEGSS